MRLDLMDVRAVALPLAGRGDAGRARVLDAALVPAVKDTVHIFLSQHAGALGPLTDPLEAVVSQPLTADEALALPTVHLRDGARGDVAWSAATVAAAMSAAGHRVPWRARFSRPRAVRFGRWSTPPTLELSVVDAVVRFDGGEQPLDQATAQQVSVPLGERALWIAEAAPSDALWVDADPAFSATPAAEIAGVVGAAMGLIRDHAPEYVPWVDRVVRTIVPLSSPIETSLSRSVKGEHGIVYASFPSDAIHTAEVLVHEAAHQYFNILEHKHRMADLLVDGAVYHSPYVNRERRIDRILFAYHAFANVLVFHRKCLAAGLDPRLYAYNPLAEQERLLRIVDGHLRASGGLTGAGRALYEPLAEALK